MTPRPPHVWPHGPVACIATPRAWPFHLVLLCVTPHAVIICTATARASLATYHARKLPPRPDLIDRATSSFSVHSSNFGLSGEFFVPRSIPIFFDARSDDLIIFNKLQMNPDLMENISRVSGFFEKFHNTEIRVFRPISGLPVVLPKVSCFKRPLNQSTTLSNHCLVAYLSHGSDKNNLIVRDSTTQKILDHFFFFFYFGFVPRR